ncbi:tyrosine transaminase family protein [Artemisia annua]|uniref:Tyrosine transaminase family protein n=1 Tax=Artemisia annua TaxID=35608 RepID=A0A2U1LFF4_ARTAN|nr:tyrosine transaminase family protein [Artemisia annua]
MENGSKLTNKKWGFRGNTSLKVEDDTTTIRGAFNLLISNINPSDKRTVIPMSHSEPSAFPCFKTTKIATDAIADAVRSNEYNGYPPREGILPARRAVAEYLSKDLPNKLSPDDVFLRMGCKQAFETILQVLGGSRSNILLPKPGFPYYDVLAKLYHLEPRFYDLLPEKNWEIDLDSVVAVADENTVAMVIVNPGNPCGNVFTYQHLKKVAETAWKLGILVISDEVYGHVVFGENPFVPMGVFGSITPVVTVGSMSKRWMVPGWRIGWLVTHDPNGILKQHGIIDSIKECRFISSDPPSFVQGAIPDILANTKEDFFSKTVNTIRECADYCHEGIKDVPGVTCPTKPEGAMCVMVKLDMMVFKDIKDDMDFCVKLAREESVLLLPGISVGLQNWLRITFAIDPSSLQDGIKRLKAFCERHSKIA